ncbi:hypothetical protein FOA52_011377 [Chlamydomonas sp. UWO 241]|nr:hypothetical protein FOA52_011377 [Chlamydomonas sp. UWO 241]
MWARCVAWAAELAGMGPRHTLINWGRLHAEAAVLLLHTPALPFSCRLAESCVAPGSGSGVFLVGTAVARGTALCLYPGREIPALPHGCMPLDGGDGPSVAHSRAHPEHSSYVLAIDVGGTMDGLDAASMEGGANPSCVGHMINHCGGRAQPNVHMASFSWRHVALGHTQVVDGFQAPSGTFQVPSAQLPAAPGGTQPPGGAAVADSPERPHLPPSCYPVATQLPPNCLPAAAQLLPLPLLARFHIPNQRLSGFWFVDPTSGETVDLPPASVSEAVAIGEGVSGIAVVAMVDIPAGSELLLDYQLIGPPWPAWAKDWYVPRSVVPFSQSGPPLH